MVGVSPSCMQEAAKSAPLANKVRRWVHGWRVRNFLDVSFRPSQTANVDENSIAFTTVLLLLGSSYSHINKAPSLQNGRHTKETTRQTQSLCFVLALAVWKKKRQLLFSLFENPRLCALWQNEEVYRKAARRFFRNVLDVWYVRERKCMHSWVRLQTGMNKITSDCFVVH